MGYYIFDHGRSESAAAMDDPASMAQAALASLLSSGTTAQRQRALNELVERRAEGTLIECLASADETTNRLAMHGLWECWLSERGSAPRQRLEEGVAAMSEGDLRGAVEIFQELMAGHPTWAEAINKLATVLYLQGQPEKSIVLCREVLALKPDHFGAWNGMALCAIQTEQWTLALEAVQQSLRLQPYSGTNQQLLTLVETRLMPR